MYEMLSSEWRNLADLDLIPITPAILGPAAPRGSDLIGYNERSYAEFCRAFEHAATTEILRYDPTNCTVLVNDISEGPVFRTLAERGYRVFTIYHVDVIAYIAAIYCRGYVTPETLASLWRRLARLHGFAPRILKLVFEKQEASARYSTGLIVPSPAMKETLLRCYPEMAARQMTNSPSDAEKALEKRVHVIPWGAPAVGGTADPEELRREFGVPADAVVLLTLSRISPEKGQDLLLEALLEWERRDDFPGGDFPKVPLWLFICGGAAYMHGQKHRQKLQNLAARLRKIRVVFPGHVTGARKEGFFALADIYVFPSRHESYGLTMLEAMQAGLPIVCLDHAGARAVMRPEFGEMTTPSGLREALARLIPDPARRQRCADAARKYARLHPFTESATRLWALLSEK